MSHPPFRVNIKGLLAWSRRDIWTLSNCSRSKFYNHLFHKRMLNHLVPLERQNSLTESQVRVTGKTLTLLKQEDMILNRSNHQRCSIKKGVLGNFAKFAWKYLCQGLFLIKMQALGLRPATLLKKRLWHKCFPVNLWNFSKHLFYRTPLDGCF